MIYVYLFCTILTVRWHQSCHVKMSDDHLKPLLLVLNISSFEGCLQPFKATRSMSQVVFLELHFNICLYVCQDLLLCCIFCMYSTQLVFFPRWRDWHNGFGFWDQWFSRFVDFVCLRREGLFGLCCCNCGNRMVTRVHHYFDPCWAFFLISRSIGSTYVSISTAAIDNILGLSTQNGSESLGWIRSSLLCMYLLWIPN